MNLVEVKSILNKYTKTGKRKDGTPWTKRFFIGIMEDGEERGISTFAHIDEDKLYEMELESEEREGKTYWTAKSAKEFTAKGEPDTSRETKQTNKPSPETQSALPATDTRIAALKCSLIYYDKAQKGISADDVLATARVFEEYLNNG